MSIEEVIKWCDTPEANETFQIGKVKLLRYWITIDNGSHTIVYKSDNELFEFYRNRRMGKSLFKQNL